MYANYGLGLVPNRMNLDDLNESGQTRGVLAVGVILLAVVSVAVQLNAQPQLLELGDVGEPLWASGESTLAVPPITRHGTSTERYDHGDPTPFEQFMLEWVNRARANPGAEAARLGIDLNQDLDPGTITDTPKPPLALNPNLLAAARAHSQWMLDTDTFSHTGVNGSTPGARMQSAGYVFSGSWTWGENISWRGTTGTPDLGSFVALMHDGLFRSAGHRRNLCNAGFDEIGVGVRLGVFTSSGRDWNASMGTQKFARSASTPGPQLVGVIYHDTNGNGFYDPGEGVPGITVLPSSGAWHAVTSTSGGYALPYSGGGTVTFSGAPLARPHSVQLLDTGTNVKLDLELGSLAYAGFVQQSIRWTPGQGFTAEVEGTPGTVVALDVSTDFQSWNQVTSVTLGQGQTVVTDPASGSQPVRFYRLRQAQ